jgi:hypothetical protein
LRASVATRNLELDALADSARNGLLQIFPGFQPATPEADTRETALVTLQLGDPAFAKANDGKITLRKTVGDKTVENSGKPAWFRIWRADGRTSVCDGKIGTDMTLKAKDLPAGAEVDIESLTIELPMEPKA